MDILSDLCETEHFFNTLVFSEEPHLKLIF